MGIKRWNRTVLTGGGATALDGIAIASLTDGDRADVVVEADGNKYYFYVFDSAATDAESSPNVIRPDDYSTAGVWKLASSPYGDLQVQVEVVSGLPINGNITGGDISRASNTTLTVSPITCLDSGLTTKLYKSTDTTFTVPHTGSLSANTIYHTFLVKLAVGGTFEFRTYTTEAAVASDADVSKYRWIGAWLTNGSSQLVQGLQVGDLFTFGKASETIITGSLTTSYATYSHSSLLPTSRVREIEYGVNGAEGIVFSSLDGTNLEEYIGYSYVADGQGDTQQGAFGHCRPHAGLMPFTTARQFKSSASGTDLLCKKVRWKR